MKVAKPDINTTYGSDLAKVVENQAKKVNQLDELNPDKLDEVFEEFIAENTDDAGRFVKGQDEAAESLEKKLDEGIECGSSSTIVQDCISKISDTLKQVGKCDEFAKALIKKLDNEHLPYEIIGVWSDTSIIYSDELGDFISTNFYHYGIRVNNIVYDNVHFTGMRYENWKIDMGGDEYIIMKPVNEINPPKFIEEMRNRIE